MQWAREHPLVFKYDDAIHTLNEAWERFNNCPLDETDTAVLEIKIAQNRVDQVIRKAKEQSVKSITLKSRLADARPPFWLRCITFRIPGERGEA